MLFRENRQISYEDRLAKEVDQALNEMKAAENMLNYSKEPELVESAVLEMESARKRYNFLLRKLREQKMISQTET